MSKIVSVQTLQQEKVSRGTQLGQLLLPWLFPIGLIVLANCLQHGTFRKSDFTCTNGSSYCFLAPATEW